MDDPIRERLCAAMPPSGLEQMDADGLQALIDEHLADAPRERRALRTALIAGVRSIFSGPGPHAAAAASLIKELERAYGLSPDVARWAVDSWSLALTGNLSADDAPAEAEPPAMEEPVADDLPPVPARETPITAAPPPPVTEEAAAPSLFGVPAESPPTSTASSETLFGEGIAQDDLFGAQPPTREPMPQDAMLVDAPSDEQPVQAETPVHERTFLYADASAPALDTIEVPTPERLTPLDADPGRRPVVPVAAGVAALLLIVAVAAVLAFRPRRHVPADAVTEPSPSVVEISPPSGDKVAPPSAGARTVTETRPLVFPVQRQVTNQLPEGAERVIQEGARGQEELVWKVPGGAQEERTLVSRRILTAPVARIVQVGARAPIAYSEETETVSIPFGMRRLETRNLPRGARHVQEPGTPGVRKITWRVGRRGKRVVARQKIRETVVTPAAARVVLVGTGTSHGENDDRPRPPLKPKRPKHPTPQQQQEFERQVVDYGVALQRYRGELARWRETHSSTQ